MIKSKPEVTVQVPDVDRDHRRKAAAGTPEPERRARTSGGRK